MGVLGVIKVQRPTDAVDDGVGDSDSRAAFETLVVFGAHSGKEGDFFAAEPGNTATSPEVGQSGLRRSETGSPRCEELGDVVLCCHVTRKYAHHDWGEGPCQDTCR